LDASLLIADSDAQSCGRLRDFFSRFGFAVETASSGLECWSKLRVLEPDVLILDLDMPWGGGDGVVARLQEDLRLDEPPAVLVTGDGSPETLAARAGLPRTDCYAKPVRMERMIDSVCLALALAEERRSRALPESTHVV
jgi:DNA-binding NtrC family response regulator